MYRSDSHMHSIASLDCDATRADMVKGAIALGMNDICFTDHYDIINMDGSYQPQYDWSVARKEQQAANTGAQDHFSVRFGAELGNVPRDFEAAERALCEPELDFVLCSVHNLCAQKGGTDFYDVPYDPHALCYAHLDDYFANMEKSVAWGRFDVLAHVPYPMRYMRQRDGQDISFTPYREQIRAILRQCVEKGIGIELNTKGWCREMIQDYANLLSDYRALGGEIVTVGSDAHTSDAIGAHLQQAHALLRQLGYRYFAVYRSRKPYFERLEDEA